MCNKFYVYTLGCRVNQYESEAIITSWERAGFFLTQSVEEAQYIILNTCAVTETTLRDVRVFLSKYRDVCRRAVCILTGCATQLLEEEIHTVLPNVHCVWQHEKETLLSYHGSAPRASFSLPQSKKSRPTVVIQDGCSHLCTYCIIPYTRGASKSRSMPYILQDIENLVQAGYKEIGISAVNMRQFGQDYALPYDVWDLVQRLERRYAALRGEIRFRLSSLEPCQLNAKALEVLSQSKLVCPHLHISLQSGSQRILKKMGRNHYTPYMVSDAVKQCAKIWNIFALGVDIITGFPSETEEDFQETKACIMQLPLTYGHIFHFSERPFTKAKDMDGKIPYAIRRERAKILRAVVFEKKKAFISHVVSTALEQSIVSELHDSSKGMSQYFLRTLCVDAVQGERQYTAIPCKNTAMGEKYLAVERYIVHK